MAVNRETVLKLVALMVFLFIFDNNITVSPLPFLRNPAAVVGLLVVALFLAFNIRQLRLRQGPQVWALLLLLITASIEFVHTANLTYSTPGESLLRYLQWGQVLVFFVICMEVFRDPRAPELVGLAFLLSVTFIAVVVLLKLPYFYSFASDSFGDRIGYRGINVNTQAFLFGMASIAIFWYLLNTWPLKYLRQFLLAGMLLVLFYGMFSTGSRGAFIVTVLGMFYLVATSMRRQNTSAYVLFIPLVIGIAGLLFLRTGVLLERLGATLEGQHYSGRDQYFWASLELIKQRPWLGYGTEYLDFMGVAQGRDNPRSTHNGIMQVLLAYGMVGLLTWLTVLASVLRRVWRIRHTQIGKLFLALTIASVAYLAFADLSFNKQYWAFLALAGCVVHYAHEAEGRLLEQPSAAARRRLPVRSAGPFVKGPAKDR